MVTAEVELINIKTALQKLVSVRKGLQKGLTKNDFTPTLKMESDMEKVMLSVKKKPFRYSVMCGFPENKMHIKTYSNYAMHYKKKAVADVEDIQLELRKTKCNIERCISLITKLIETNLYRDKMQLKMDRFRVLKGEAKPVFIMI